MEFKSGTFHVEHLSGPLTAIFVFHVEQVGTLAALGDVFHVERLTNSFQSLVPHRPLWLSECFTWNHGAPSKMTMPENLHSATLGLFHVEPIKPFLLSMGRHCGKKLGPV